MVLETTSKPPPSRKAAPLRALHSYLVPARTLALLLTMSIAAATIGNSAEVPEQLEGRGVVHISPGRIPVC